MGVLVGPAALCTSLDMNGFSLSFLALKGQLPALLDGHTTAPAWPGATSMNRIPLTPLPFKPHDVSHLAKTTPSKDVFVESLLDRVCHVLEDSKEELDQLILSSEMVTLDLRYLWGPSACLT